MFKNNKCISIFLIALGLSPAFNFSEAKFSENQSEDQNVLSNKDQIDEFKSKEQDLIEKINEIGKKRYECIDRCREFEQKFRDIYKNKSDLNENEYNEAVEKGRSLVLECIALTDELEPLLEKYLKEFKEYCQSSVELKAKYIGFSRMLKIIYSDSGYLSRWLGFVDGKYDKPPMLYLNMWWSSKWFQKLDSLCGSDIVSLENIANNFDYVFSDLEIYYYDVDYKRQTFDPSKWNSLVCNLEGLVDDLAECHVKYLNACRELYDSMDSDEKCKDLFQDDFLKTYYNSVQEFKEDLILFIKDRVRSLDLLNGFKNYISTNKEAKSLPETFYRI